MCDTLVSIVQDQVVFAKNSDRDPNEAQSMVWIPAADYASGETLRTTYMQIPQAKHTHAVLLSKPFWMWGAEMGLNEHGLVIGNEAVFSREPAGKTNGLIGMDYLRLALERTRTAPDALQLIVEMLEQYGQSGNCGYAHPFYYHNSYLIADRTQAWILETVGKRWAAQRVRGVGSISNALSISEEWDLGSKDLADYALQQGWLGKGETFSFARCYSDKLYTRFADGHNRQACTLNALKNAGDTITPLSAMQMLRLHPTAKNASWSPDSAVVGADVCMHAGFGPVRGSQTAASLVVQITAEQVNAWATGTAAPCTSIFKPVWVDAQTAWTRPAPQGRADAQTLFWKHEALHRSVLLDYAPRLALYSAERDALEQQFFQASVQAAHGSLEGRRMCCLAAEQDAWQATERWTKTVTVQPVARKSPFYYRTTWNNLNRAASLDLP